MADDKYDPYPRLDEQDELWLMALIGGLCNNPVAANFARVRSGIDLEIMITVAPEDRATFTDEVCLAAVGFPKPAAFLFSNFFFLFSCFRLLRPAKRDSQIRLYVIPAAEPESNFWILKQVQDDKRESAIRNFPTLFSIH